MNEAPLTSKVESKEMADKIMDLAVRAQRIENEKTEMQHALGVYSWHQVETEAMRYLWLNQNDGQNVAR